MAEARRFADPRYGHTGRLTYIPRDDRLAGEPGALHTSHLTSNRPHFKQIGSSAELYPASKTELPHLTHSHLWAERNLQKRWLFKSHPEALMGNMELAGFLTEDIDRFRKLDESATPQPLLAMGQMTDLYQPTRAKAAPVLAMATGESGELLRLSHVDDSRWAWGDSEDTTLGLSVIDPTDPDEEAIWASDGLPISQIKFASSGYRGEPTRWIIVQKETSTTILQPEYHRTPRAQNAAYSRSPQKLSRIVPNATLNLGHKETGGNAHSDVAYNPPSGDGPAQLCVVDECGYWTLWNVSSLGRIDKRNLRLVLHRCGHILEGSLDSIPEASSYPAERHGVLFVGSETTGGFWEENPEDGLATARRSTHLLVWNSESFEVFNIETVSRLPKIREFSTARLKFDHILDIAISPVNQNHVFVLTGRFIVWINIFPNTEDLDSIPKPEILLTCTHGVVNRNGLSMAVNRATSEAESKVMVSLYSSNNEHVIIHWFGHNSESKMPQWFSQSTAISCKSDGSERAFTIQHLLFDPSTLRYPAGATSQGAKYQREGVQFYQGIVLGQDLSVRYCMCAAYPISDFKVSLPMNRLRWAKVDQDRRWRKKRLNALRHIGQSAVVPDSMTDELLATLTRRRRDNVETHELGLIYPAKNPLRPIQIKVDILVEAIEKFSRDSQHHSGLGLPEQFFDALTGAIHDSSDGEALPLTTWQELASEVVLNRSLNTISADDIHETLQDFLFETSLNRNDERIVVMQLERQLTDEPTQPLGSLSQLHDSLLSTWLEPIQDQLSERQIELRRGWLSELAINLFLSLHGVVVQETPLFGSQPSAPPLDTQPSLPSSIPMSSSQIGSSPPASSPASSKAREPDDAFRRLQVLAPDIKPGKIGSARPAKVLSYWPIQRGADLNNYTSSVSVASDKKLDPARQRLQRMEAKKKAMAEKYKLPAFLRSEPSRSSTQLDSSQSKGTPLRGATAIATPGPPMQIMSSQGAGPASSQTQGPPMVTMSQPVPGMFGGDRKKLKSKTKKKSGFR